MRNIQNLIIFTNPGPWFYSLPPFLFLNSSYDYFSPGAASYKFIKMKDRLYLCLPGVGALCGGLGAQTDVLFQHSFLSQLPTQHQQIWSVLFNKYKYLIFIQLAAVLHHLLLPLISML